MDVKNCLSPSCVTKRNSRARYSLIALVEIQFAAYHFSPTYDVILKLSFSLYKKKNRDVFSSVRESYVRKKNIFSPLFNPLLNPLFLVHMSEKKNILFSHTFNTIL